MPVSESDPVILKEFHRVMMSSTAMWLNVLDKDAKVIMWSKGAEKISGYKKEEVLGKSDIWELLYPEKEYRAQVFIKALEIINQGEEVTDFETIIRCKDESNRILSWNSHDVKNEHGDVIGSMALARDVTETHTSHKKLKELTGELEQTNQRLLQLSETDELTGLYNRRFMEKFLQEEWERHIRSTKPLSLLYIDIDFFKQYNDTYGHHKGDEVLAESAIIVKKHARRTVDKAARFGGEEFAIILPETNHDEAVMIAEKLRHDVEHKKIEHRASKIANVLTVSIGVATMFPTHSEPVTKLKIEADIALYKAKKLGRNRVEKMNN